MKTLVFLLLVAIAQGNDIAEGFGLFKFITGKPNTYLNTNPLPYDEAVLFCRQIKMRLLEIGKEIENKDLYKFMQDYNYKRFWIGLHRRSDVNDSDTKTFWWNDDPEKPVLNFWGPLEPNNFRNHKERCVEVRMLAKNTPLNNWNDAPCDRKYNAICASIHHD